MNNKSTDPKSCFAKNLKDYMDRNSVSRKKLSDDLNIKYSTICEWLKGTMLPRADKLELVADYFKTTSSKLLEDPNVEILTYKYPYVTKIPAGYSLERASDEFFAGWGIISMKRNVEPHFGIQTTHECNPSQPHYANGEPISFTITDKIFDFGRDYVIRRDGHDAEIVTIYQDPNVISHIRFVMVPVYNEEKNYTPFYFNDDESGYEILGIVDK